MLFGRVKYKSISTQISQKDSPEYMGKSKYSVSKPKLDSVPNGVVAFLWGKWLKSAFLLGAILSGRQGYGRHLWLWTIKLVLATFLFAFSFNIAIASSGSIFGFGGLDWVKSQVVGIFFEDEQEVQAPETQSLLVSQDSYLIKTSSPDADISNIDQRRELVIDYKVEEGDTLTKIANDFGISLNTLLWANDLTQRSVIKIGQELKILPIDGVIYTVKRGETLLAIANKYKADQSQIIDFNDLPADKTLKEGVQLIIPNGVVVNSNVVAVKSNTVTVKKAAAVATTSAVKKAAALALEVAEKMFIIPVSGIITQGRHNYTPPAVDIGNSCGTPVFAAADGVVSYVDQPNSRSRYAGGGYGNNIRIQHSNGSMSIYAHLFAGSLSVSKGDTVEQGQQIAEIGGGWDNKNKRARMVGAGNSTGCHLHFEVRNGVNILTNTAKYRRGMTIKTPAANLAIDTSDIGAGDSGDDTATDQGTGFTGVISEPYKGNN